MRDTPAQAVAASLRSSGVDDRDLDEWVLEHCQHAASQVNNGGLERQVGFLLAHGETAGKILDAFGLNGAGSANGLEEALRQCAQALAQLSAHPAFAGDAPEFNEGGIGYQARRRAEEVLNRRRRVDGH